MDHDDFRKLIFEVLEHHLHQIHDCQDWDQVSYQIERCEWAIAYLKRYTVAAPPKNEQEEQVLYEMLKR